MAPWIRDSEGNDALDLSGIPTPGDPLFDDASAEQTFGSNPVTSAIDGADDAARDVGAVVAGFPIVGAVGMDGQAGEGTLTDTAQETRETVEQHPEMVRYAIYAAVAVGVLVLVRPLLEIVANLSEA